MVCIMFLTASGTDVQRGRAPGNEHQAREQAMAELQRQAKQPSTADRGQQAEGQQEKVDRPSEWTGFIFNPYSGDLLPPEDDDLEGDDEEHQSGETQAGDGEAGGYGGSRCILS